MASFHEVMQTLHPQGEHWIGHVPEDWLQGRSVFGGLQVSMMLHAMRAQVAADLPLRSLQAAFMAPVGAGELYVQAAVLRAGKNTMHVEARLLDGERNTLCLVIGIFGASRASSIAIRPVQPPIELPPRPFELPNIPGVTPVFMQHFRMRWLQGAMPYTGAAQAKAVIEVSVREQGMANESHLPAIADAIPPLALSLLKKPAPGSSMTWMLELLCDRYDHQPLQGWRVDAEVLAAADGYTSQTAMIWAPDGSPALLSRQNMVVFG